MHMPIRSSARLDAILALLKSKPDAQTLAVQLFAPAVPDDIAPYSDRELAALATSGIEFLRQRKPGRPKVRIMPVEGGITVVEIINDDMPFLVDSILTLLTEKGCEIRLVFHPSCR